MIKQKGSQAKRVSQQSLTDWGSTPLYLTLPLSNFRFRLTNCWLTFAAPFIRSRSEIHPCDTVVLRWMDSAIAALCSSLPGKLSSGSSRCQDLLTDPFWLSPRWQGLETGPCPDGSKFRLRRIQRTAEMEQDKLVIVRLPGTKVPT